MITVFQACRVTIPTRGSWGVDILWRMILSSKESLEFAGEDPQGFCRGSSGRKSKDGIATSRKGHGMNMIQVLLARLSGDLLGLSLLADQCHIRPGRFTGSIC